MGYSTRKRISIVKVLARSKKYMEWVVEEGGVGIVAVIYEHL